MKKNKKFEIETIVAMDTLNSDMMSLILGGVGTPNGADNCENKMVTCGKECSPFSICSPNNQCNPFSICNPKNQCNPFICSPNAGCCIGTLSI